MDKTGVAAAASAANVVINSLSGHDGFQTQ